MAFLPISGSDLKERNIEQLDFIMVSGDAYVDHHSFGHALISRFIESKGFTIGIIAQPQRESDYLALGTPKHAFLISSGVVESMVNNYTVAKKKRTEDSYSPGGQAGLRPDRATIVYTKKLRKHFGNVPILIGGIEASLRRFSHYDYWRDCVMPSILVDSGANLLIYGMGEKPFDDILNMVTKGIPIDKIRDVRGTAYLSDYTNLSKKLKDIVDGNDNSFLVTHSHMSVINDKVKFAESFRVQSQNTDSINGKGIIQKQAEDLYLIQNPPQAVMSEAELDDVYSLNFERTYHPIYESMGGVPAIEEVKFSIASHRGCFGSCSFCALNYHQGRVIQSRSDESIINEAIAISAMPDFKGYIHDVGGPTANFRNTACEAQKKNGVCQNKYCIGDKPCSNLRVDHTDYLRILQKLRKLPNIKKVFVRSGVRFDYVMYDKNGQFLDELIKYHISGQLKIAPEHISDNVLKVMNKPKSKIYLDFANRYQELNKKKGMNQFIVPYFISSHPGSTLKDAIELCLYLKSINYMPMQVQDFYPTPSTRATCMFHTGIDPDTMKEVYVPKDKHEKAMQRALLQYRKKENYNLIREALIMSGREDLIGFSKECIIKPLRSDAATSRQSVAKANDKKFYDKSKKRANKR